MRRSEHVAITVPFIRRRPCLFIARMSERGLVYSIGALYGSSSACLITEILFRLWISTVQPLNRRSMYAEGVTIPVASISESISLRSDFSVAVSDNMEIYTVSSSMTRGICT